MRPIETEETLPSGKILLGADYRERLTAMQAEVVAIGAPEPCDEPDTCERLHLTNGRSLHILDPRITIGAWVVIKKWAYLGLADDLYAVRHSDVIGVFVED